MRIDRHTTGKARLVLPMPGRRGIVAITALIVAAAAASVIGSRATASDGSTSSIDACSLITHAEADAALNASTVKRDGGTVCTFVATSGGFGAVGTAVDGLRFEDGFHEGMLMYAQAAGGSLTTVNALGDEAYAVVSDLSAQVRVRVGERQFSILLLGSRKTGDDQIRLMSDLARAALPRFR